MNIRSFIYNFFITFTSNSYAEVLKRLPENTHLLDVGVGTGKPILANAIEIKLKSIQITGIDIDEDYLKVAQNKIAKAGLSNLVNILHTDICTSTLPATYDAVYFSDSFMIIPKSNHLQVLQKVIASLNFYVHKTIYFTQTHEHKHSWVVGFMKPLLKWFTTINFGQVTYENDFIKTLDEAGLIIIERKVIYTSKKRAMVLIAAKAQ